MAMKNNATNPADLLNEPMQVLYGLLCQLIDGGLTPEEAHNVLCAMVFRAVEVHTAAAPARDVNE